ncbi:hypothetical protein Q5752_005389 [Cryptotrichosporon argae]
MSLTQTSTFTEAPSSELVLHLVGASPLEKGASFLDQGASSLDMDSQWYQKAPGDRSTDKSMPWPYSPAGPMGDKDRSEHEGGTRRGPGTDDDADSNSTFERREADTWLNIKLPCGATRQTRVRTQRGRSSQSSDSNTRLSWVDNAAVPKADKWAAVYGRGTRLGVGTDTNADPNSNLTWHSADTGSISTVPDHEVRKPRQRRIQRGRAHQSSDSDTLPSKADKARDARRARRAAQAGADARAGRALAREIMFEVNSFMSGKLTRMPTQLSQFDPCAPSTEEGLGYIENSTKTWQKTGRRHDVAFDKTLQELMGKDKKNRNAVRTVLYNKMRSYETQLGRPGEFSLADTGMDEETLDELEARLNCDTQEAMARRNAVLRLATERVLKRRNANQSTLSGNAASSVGSF